MKSMSPYVKRHNEFGSLTVEAGEAQRTFNVGWHFNLICHEARGIKQ